MQRSRSPLFRWAPRLAIAGALLLLAAAAVENRIEARVRARLSADETFATIGGRQIRYRLKNADRPAPTLVFLNGFVASVEAWDPIVEGLNGIAPTLAYDRDGLGLSEGKGARDAAGMLHELDSALRIAGVKPPFLLVSYSASGLLAEVFVKQHPSDIAGLVFLDTVMPEQQAGDVSAGEKKRVAGVYKGMIKTTIQTALGIARVRTLLNHGGVPLGGGEEIILFLSHWRATFNEASVDAELARQGLGFSPPQVPVAMLSTRGQEASADLKLTYALQHKLADGSGHAIFRDLTGVAHDTLIRDPRGVAAAVEIIRAELAALRTP
jgi:pimeloyl-ACP methyl ester carboxylesterase